MADLLCAEWAGLTILMIAKAYSSILILFIIFGACVPMLAGSLDDKAVTAKLVGTWMSRPGEFAPGTLTATAVYRANGTSLDTGSFAPFLRSSVFFEFEGRWRVEHGILIVEVTKTNQPDYIRAGHVDRDVIVAITDEECWLRDQYSKAEHILTRYKR